MTKAPLTEGQVAIWGESRWDLSALGQSLIFEVGGDSSSYRFAAAKLNKEDGFSCADRSESIASSCVSKRKWVQECTYI